MRPMYKQAPAHPSNYAVGRQGHGPLAIVFHIMQGTAAGTAAWFAQPRPQPSSTHFGIARDGTIEQYVAEGNTAYSNGILVRPQVALIPWVRAFQESGVSPNVATLSIELEGEQRGTWAMVGGVETFLRGSIDPWWTPTPAQYAGCVALTRDLVQTYAIRVDRAHLCRHSDFDQARKWWCPGLGFPLGQLIRDLGGTV